MLGKRKKLIYLFCSQSRAFAATGAAASPPSFPTHQNIKADGQDPSATSSHEPPVALPELPSVYYNGSNFYYPSYPSYHSNKRNNYGHAPYRYNNSSSSNTHQPYAKYKPAYQQQQQHYHYQPLASVPNRHEGTRSFIDNQKNIQVGGRSARGGYNMNKPRYFRNGPDANATTDSNGVESGLNKLTMNEATVSHPPPSALPHKQAQQQQQQQRQPSTTYQNNKHPYHTKSGNNSKFINNNNSHTHYNQQQQPNVPYTKPNYTTNNGVATATAAPSSQNTNANATASTTHKNTHRNNNPQTNPSQKQQQQSHPPSVQQQPQPQPQQQQHSKKKGRHSNNQQPHDNNSSNTHHAGGGKIDNKKKKGNNKSTVQESQENANKEKQEGKIRGFRCHGDDVCSHFLNSAWFEAHSFSSIA